jgi:hypothetical protein
MGSVNNTNTSLDLNVRIFDQFYKYDFAVPANEYDQIYSFFASKFESEQAALYFATSLFQISVTTDIPVQELFQGLIDQGSFELSLTMAYYINGIRSRSTLLGVNQVTKPNFYAARNVIQ